MCVWLAQQLQKHPAYEDNGTKQYKVDGRPAGLSWLEDGARLQLINRWPLNGNLAVRNQWIALLNNWLDNAAKLPTPQTQKFWTANITILVWRDGTAGWGTALQVGGSRVRFPMVSIEYFIGISLPLNQPLTEMSTRNISWGVMAVGA